MDFPCIVQQDALTFNGLAAIMPIKGVYLQQDFAHRNDRDRLTGEPARRPSPSRRLLPILSVLGLGFVAVTMLVMVGSGQQVSASVSPSKEEWLAPEMPDMAKLGEESRITLQDGDTAISALTQLGLSMPEIMRAVKAAQSVYPLKDVHAGHLMTRTGDTDSMQVYYDIDSGQRLQLQRETDGQWQAAIEERPVRDRLAHAEGRIEDSLFGAAEKAGLDDTTTMNLVDIFSWDIDFARDIRTGDSFRVLYHEHYDARGRMIGSTILAAEFTNQGQTYRAVRYQTADGRYDYFTPDGKSMRKSFLKAPLKYTRISSRYSLHRMHPILGYTRAHRGVDYAAPMGTPVHAVGDGVITYCGWRGGYGRFIVIRHTDGVHSTAYAHLSRYARGIHSGAHVHQGQVIAFVGMSGLATGPHLHFEFRIHGVQVNPLTVKRTPAAPVPQAQMASFRQATAPLLARIEIPQPLLAWN
jgi:murein DD-endopeptidase MepM/ murein hydrolase activator NlpD